MPDKLITQVQDNIAFVLFMTIIFSTLRILSVIEWPWIWIVSPLWIFPAVAAAVVLTGIAFGSIAAVVELSYAAMTLVYTAVGRWWNKWRRID